MAGHKSAKKSQTILALNWGTPSGGKTPSSSPRRGVGVSSAARAGVTRDHYLTLMAQGVAAELEQDRIQKERAAKAADTRTSFDKKYDVLDGVAHISVNVFFHQSAWGSRFRSEGVKAIHIGGEMGLNAKFEFYDADIASAPERQNLRLISPTALKEDGLLKHMKVGETVFLLSKARNMGWLTLEASMQTQAVARPSTFKALSAMDGENNFADLFMSRAGLKYIAETAAEPVEMTKQFTNRAEQAVSARVGYLHPVAGRDIAQLPVKSFREIWMVATGSNFKDADALRSAVYKKARAILVCADNTLDEPLAIISKAYNIDQ